MTIEKRDRLGKTHRYPSVGKSGLAIVLLLFTTLITACETADEAPNADSNVTTEEVAEQTEKVEGQAVTVRSEIEKQVGENSFTLDNDGEEILVINTSGKPFLLPEEDDYAIQATGEVQNFVLVDLERDYNLGLDPEVYAEYETKPALLANSLALAPDPGEITQNPEKFYDLAIAVEGEVEDVLDPTSFTLDEEQLFGATDLLVINTPITEALDGETVTVTGQLRKFVLADFERDYDLTWDLDVKKKLEAEYSDKPVFVADSLYPKAQ
ncbi:hypothetical protein C1752_10218 [Acaryochloris thomasi RCC1774]|uniref:Uncharacterized protein n=1 Tax=Acaryochloris thomasi RCC1774 TaxID=1764569 RepID=A0A2W1J8I8_9CYAN|nr:hypothetical protein [Acaryochloris thomasi]PZD70703.1 hypothetical protein C1752_10218 [Acaryochloris thomasi RCC1774]